MMKMSEILKYLGDSVNDEIVRLLSPCKRMTSSNITCIVSRVLSMLLSGGTAPLYSNFAPLYYIYPYTMHPSPFIGLFSTRTY